MNREPIHIVSPEYPPQIGGVADHTAQLASGLARRGYQVHVWTRRGAAAGPDCVHVHDIFGRFERRELAQAARALSEWKRGGRLIIQWVPHGFGYRSMNLGFCIWIWKLAKLRGYRIELVVHEPFLMFGEGSWKQDAAAVIHRVMIILLLQAVTRAWISIPAWEQKLRPWCLGRPLRFEWLPVPSNILPVAGIDSTANAAGEDPLLIGHFGTYGTQIRELLRTLLLDILRHENITVVLLGRGSEKFRKECAAELGESARRVIAKGVLADAELSTHLNSCHLMIQPFVDGVSSRRSSVMAALAHGLPLVTTEGPATEDIWRKSRAVHLVNAGDTSAFIRAVSALANDPAERQRLGKRGKRLYDEEFSIERTLERVTAAIPAVQEPACAL
jgi:glycosyltransferase involved in cell wall biosynthesis